jgi:dsRNA-specific ribonuclease
MSSEQFDLYNNEETLKVKGFKNLIIKESIQTAVENKPDELAFKNFISSLMIKRGNINEETVLKLLDEQGLERVKMAFTHSSMIGESNYEFFEMLGDRSVNKAIIWYMHRRFPEIEHNEKAAMYMTELKKRYENKRNFGAWAKKLGFDQFIRYKELSYVEGKFIKKVRINDSMLEDTFEAFCGILEDLIDSRIGIGVGYGFVYNIITSLLDEEYITTDLNKLVDVKTQLKELIENAAIKKFGGKVDSNSYQDANKKFVSTLNLSFTSNPSSTYKGSLTQQFASRPQYKKIDAENEAARMTLDWLKMNMGLKWIDFK